jgi:predicted esterase
VPAQLRLRHPQRVGLPALSGLSRRGFLGLAAAHAGLFALGDADAAEAPTLAEQEVAAPGDRRLGTRFLLLTPTHLAAGERVPLVVLLHGLGETGNEAAGIRAWADRYGLTSAYTRLQRPPLAAIGKRADWPAGRIETLNRDLATRPFRGLAIACPYTPNVAKERDRGRAFDDYAAWIAEEVLPRARALAPVSPETKLTTLGGCSLGGYVSLEVFLRRPELFGAWGGVQSAFGAHRALSYAERLADVVARVGPRELDLLTSEGDPFREANVALARALVGKGLADPLRVLPGPHDQPWLRESGTLHALLFHERRAP